MSGVGEYGGLQNSAGLDMDWDLNKLILSAGYGHLNWMSATPAYDYQKIPRTGVNWISIYSDYLEVAGTN